MLGSHTATVSILEILAKIQPHFGVDPELLRGVKRWVQLRQEDDGGFLPLPADVDLSAAESDANRTARARELVLEMTAETVMTLLEVGVESDVDSDTLQKGKVFLEKGLPKAESPGAIAAVALALALMKSAAAAWAMEKLRNASTAEDGEFGWPKATPRNDAADWLYEAEAERAVKEPLIGKFPSCAHSLTSHRSCFFQPPRRTTRRPSTLCPLSA